jgi:hypothetical protein
MRTGGAQEYWVAVLNVHKPRGLTSYGQHKQAKEAKGSNKRRTAATRYAPEDHRSSTLAGARGTSILQIPRR